jgi:predicted metal-binding protein
MEVPDSIKPKGSNDASDEETTDEDVRNIIASLQDIHKDLKAVSTDKIVVSEWVRFKCRYGCPAYGRTLSCPPFSPRPEETRRLLSEYTTAVVVHSQTTPDPGWTPEQHRHHANECRTRLHKDVIEIERAAFLMGYYKALAMGVGPCNLCDACVIKEKPDASDTSEEKASASEINDFSALGCRHKDIMRPAMDAFGIDIFQTVRNSGYSIRVLKSYSDTADLFAMVLIA